MKLVCLDDDPRMEPVLRRFVGRLGHEVRFHRAAASFKAEIKTQAPDLVVLDLVLGRESSIAIIAWLARTQVQVPIVLLSGHGDEMLDAARRIAQANGIEVLGAVSKGHLVSDLPPLLAEGERCIQRSRAAPPHDLAALDRVELERCIRERHIEPSFQPIVSHADGRLRGAEVIPRLRLASGEILAAPAFLPLAESTGLALPLAEGMAARLLELKPQLKRLSLDFVALGLPTSALDQQPAIALMRILILLRTLIEGLADCCRVRIALTETCGPLDSQPVPKLAAQLDRLGASLAADDFGAAYSCIRDLAELPSETLATELSFASATLDSPRSRNLSLAIVALRRGLGLRVVEEGVEMDGQRRVQLESGKAASRLDRLAGGGGMDIQTFARACGELAGDIVDPAP